MLPGEPHGNAELAEYRVPEYLVLDTDVASKLQAGRLPDAMGWHLRSKILCVTFVTVGEFFKGAHKKNWGPGRIARMVEWLRNVVVLPYDSDVGKTWGWLAAETDRSGRPVSDNDLWIAACCVSRGVPLMTLNRKHFEGIPKLSLIP